MKKNDAPLRGYASIRALALIFLFAGCGGAGSIKSYRYTTTKYELQKAVMKVIRDNPNIYRDSSKDQAVDTTLETKYKDSPLVDIATGDNYYNDGRNYVTIKIKDGPIEDEFTFRYYGDEAYWKSSSSSEIFIVYAHDKDGNGGSDGNGDISSGMEKEFAAFFEKEFVTKISKELNLEPAINTD